ncbi:MAG: ATP-binding protein, partial [Gammaproteobacteria bacterium]|nr:ATP-binding protein [Gammaproteobacteria bacterium]
GFALSLLVDEQHYFALANYINNTRLGQRIVYYRTIKQDVYSNKLIDPQSMILKLNVNPKSPHMSWLQTELQQRFDYICVGSLQAFKNADRALTVAGQIKHNKTRHEKDDRRAVDDRRYWVLGFDNREKLALFQQQAQKLAATIADFTAQIAALTEREKNQVAKAMICQTLINLQWQEIDVLPIMERIALLEKQLIDVKQKNIPLQQISKQIEEKQKEIQKKADEKIAKEVERKSKEADINRFQKRCDGITTDPKIIQLTPQQHHGLKEHFDKLIGEQAIIHEQIDDLSSTVNNHLNNEKNQVNLDINNCEKDIEKYFAEFKRRWPVESSDMDATLASAPDYFAKLTRLESDGLPAHEQRFFELLQNQSHQNLAALSTLLNQARKAILERMELVNTSLSQAQFNAGTYLHIDATDRQLAEVREFRHEISQALSHAWSDDREFAENQFLILRKMVEKLASQDPEQKRWREAVLDVRQHVEFIGRELTEDGVEVEVYRSGAGKSGGQRQKLATTCLAAALRYQLGGNDHHVPVYAPVILDEAFDKADNEFTALAMNIFANFGFQMIVATPLKSVMTLEPFIGGACFVDINDRRVSGVLLIEYDENESKLALPDLVRAESILNAV